MATLTIRNIDDDVAAALKAQASAHGRSMEAEVRVILAAATGKTTESPGLGSRIHARFAGLGGLETPRAADMPRPARFDT